MISNIWLRGALLAGCACAGAVSESDAWNDPPAATAAVPLALVDVQVITMRSAAVLSHHTVLIRNGRIEWLGPDGSRALPTGATVIQGHGRYLMPALIDMHVHLSTADLPAYLDAGIATVRNMWGHPEIAQLTAEVASGTRDGPTIYSASQGLDGPPAQWPFTVLLTQPVSARAAVQVQKDAGWRWIKAYARLTPEIFDSIVVAAGELGIPVLGHVPMAVDVRHALASHMLSIEHLTGYDHAASRTGGFGTWAWIDPDESRYAELVQATVAAGTWNCPTLTIYAALARQNSAADRAAIIQNRRRFVKRLADAGAPLLVGTDAGIDIVPPGATIFDELDQFVAAGLTPYQTLGYATREAARFLGRTDLGVVEGGAEASLLLLRENPLSSVGTLRQNAGMVLRGAWRPAR